MRELKFHEQKLLKKVNFFQWKSENNLREIKVLRRYHVQDRDDYVRYNKLAGLVTKLSSQLKDLPHDVSGQDAPFEAPNAAWCPPSDMISSPLMPPSLPRSLPSSIPACLACLPPSLPNTIANSVLICSLSSHSSGLPCRRTIPCCAYRAHGAFLVGLSDTITSAGSRKDEGD